MDFFLNHAFAVSGLLFGILLLHLTEYIFRKKHTISVTLASINLALHLVTTAYFLFNGAGMEELLLVLLLSLSVGLVKKEA